MVTIIAAGASVFFCSTNALAQAKQKWATGLNTLSNGDGMGSKNNAAVVFYSDNIARMWLTASGGLGLGTPTPSQLLDVAGGFHLGGNAYIDSFLTALSVTTGSLSVTGSSALNDVQANSLTVTGTVDAGQYLLNGTPLTPSPWVSSGNDISYSVGTVAIGTSTSAANSSLTIVPKYNFSQLNKGIFIDIPLLNNKGSYAAIVAEGETDYSTVKGTYFGRLASAKAFSADGQMIGGVWGSVTPEHIEVNASNRIALALGGYFTADLNNLTVGNPGVSKNWIGGMYAEIKGTVTNCPDPGHGVIAAVIGNDKIGRPDSYAAWFDGKGFFSDRVGIGTETPTVALDVVGDIKASGSVIATDLTISGTSRLSRIETSRIVPPPGDSLIRFGDSTATYSTTSNRISWSPVSSQVQGFAIGNGVNFVPTIGLGLNSIAIGRMVQTGINATNAVTIGSGTFNKAGSPQPLINNAANSLFIGFNSNIPTLVVHSSQGVGTTGNISIGSFDEFGSPVPLPSPLPPAKLHIVDFGQLDESSFQIDKRVVIGSTDDIFRINKYAQNKSGLFIVHPVLIVQDTGNVGIGTTSPSERLTIKGVNNAVNFGIERSSNTNNVFEVVETAAGAGRSYIYDANGNLDILLATDGNVYFNNSGNVGIGTTCPNYKLTVNGRIKARTEVIVEEAGPWCDFVFDPDYRRMSWQEKAAYIDTARHLPSLPPGKQIEAEGLQMGAVIKGVTQEVEESRQDITELFIRMEQLEKSDKEKDDKIEKLEEENTMLKQCVTNLKPKKFQEKK